MELLIQIIVVVCVVVLNFSRVCAQSTAGFLYIDCGATTGQVDPNTGIQWTADEGYISTGELLASVPNAVSDHSDFAELATLRYFANGWAKNCYTLPVAFNQTYLLRVSFYHGGYDGATSVSFQVGVDESVLLPITISDITIHHYREFTIQPQRNFTYVCLMPDATNANPFISGISLRPVSPLPPRILDLLAINQVIFTPRRYLFGPNTSLVRYPDDVHDRVWLAQTETSGLLSATAPITGLSATRAVSLGNIPSELDPPLAVLKNAVTTSGNLTISLPNSNDVPSAYLAIYFLELDTTANITDREFMIHVPDPFYDDRYENPMNYSGQASGDYWIWKDMTYPSDTSIVMYPNPSRTSLRGPIINSLELSFTLGQQALPTNIDDVTAIEAIKGALNLTSWSGDPCLPFPYAWVDCSNITSPTGDFHIVAVNLSGYNLTGTIPDAFGGLSQLITLALDNNHLTGPFPDLHLLKNLQTLDLQDNRLSGTLPAWLTSMSALRRLYVQNNNFNGPIPAGLNTSNSLDFRGEGNPLLGQGLSPVSDGSNGKKSNVGVIIGAVVGVLVGVALLGLAIFFCLRFYRKKNQKEISQPPPNLRTGPSLRGARAFTYQEIVNATSNFKHEIGKGGFGSVYYGKLPDGQEIAVKVLDKRSVQGSSEFLNEVEILSRVHHKNVVAMVGYCEASESPLLVYEFVHNGSLRDHLTGAKSFGPEKLDWRMRVSIALNAAQGLEYLHTSCNPSFIHRDVKSSNVLLTTKWEAKIADFGLSRLVKEQEATRVMTQVKGTPGYLDPEYFNTNLLSPKTDVYSFGVVLLELITGRLPLDTSRQEQKASLCDWVRQALEAGDIDVILDPVVRASKPSVEALWKVAETAMKCIEPKSVHRPTMSEVVQELQDALSMVSSNPYNSSINYSDYSSGVQLVPEAMPEAR